MLMSIHHGYPVWDVCPVFIYPFNSYQITTAKATCLAACFATPYLSSAAFLGILPFLSRVCSIHPVPTYFNNPGLFPKSPEFDDGGDSESWH